jgi:hypothetical protein
MRPTLKVVPEGRDLSQMNLKIPIMHHCKAAVLSVSSSGDGWSRTRHYYEERSIGSNNSFYLLGIIYNILIILLISLYSSLGGL